MDRQMRITGPPVPGGGRTCRPHCSGGGNEIASELGRILPWIPSRALARQSVDGSVFEGRDLERVESYVALPPEGGTPTEPAATQRVPHGANGPTFRPPA